MTDDAELCTSCLRAPAQHPSRLHGRLEFDLELGSHRPPGPKRSPNGSASTPSPEIAPLPPLPDIGIELAKSDRTGGSATLQVAAPPQSGVEPPSSDLALELDLSSSQPQPQSPGQLKAQGRPQAPQAPAQQAEQPASAASGASGSGAGGFGALDDILADDGAPDSLDVGLALDSIPAPSKQERTEQPRVSTASRAGSTGEQQTLDGAGDELPPPPPSGPLHPEIDPFEVTLLAEYGTEPKNILEAVKYAWRVYKRRAELRTLYDKQLGIHEKTKERIQEQLASILEQVRLRVGPDDAEILAILDPIEEAKTLIANRSAELASTREQYEAQRRRVDNEVMGLERERIAHEQERSQAQVMLEDQVQTQARFSADLKRIERDIRAAHDAAASTASQDAEFASPEHARHIAELQATKARTTEQLRAADKGVHEARVVVSTHERALREHDRKVHGVKDKGNALAAQADEAHDLRVEGIRQAEQKKLDVYEKALRTIADEFPERLDEVVAVRMNRLDKEMSDSLGQLQTHRLAIDAYDREAYQRGFVVAAAVVAVAVLLILVLGINVR